MEGPRDCLVQKEPEAEEDGMTDLLSLDVDLMGAAAMLHRRYAWMHWNWQKGTER